MNITQAKLDLAKIKRQKGLQYMPLVDKYVNHTAAEMIKTIEEQKLEIKQLKQVVSKLENKVNKRQAKSFRYCPTCRRYTHTKDWLCKECFSIKPVQTNE